MLVMEALVLGRARWDCPGASTVGTVPSESGSAWTRLLALGGGGVLPLGAPDFASATSVGAGEVAVSEGFSRFGSSAKGCSSSQYGCLYHNAYVRPLPGWGVLALIVLESR